MARISPVLPLIGGGHTRFQPVFAGDVASAVAAAIEGRAEDGRDLRARRPAGEELQGADGIRAGDHRAPAPAAADPVRARQAAGVRPAAHAQAVADARPGRAAAQRQRRVGGGQARRPHDRGARHRSRRHGDDRAVLSVAVPQGRPIQGARTRRSAAGLRARPPRELAHHCASAVHVALRYAITAMPIVTNIEDLRRIARRKIPRAIYDYVERGSYDELTLAANRDDLDAIRLRQRVLIDVSKVSLGSTDAGRDGHDAGRHRADRAHRPGARRRRDAGGARRRGRRHQVLPVHHVDLLDRGRAQRGEAAVLVPALHVPRPRLQQIVIERARAADAPRCS